MTSTAIPFCCGQPIVIVRASGIDHYEETQYYCRCNKCDKSSKLRPTLSEAIRAWAERVSK